MQEEEYTFVTLDGNDVMPADAVIIDVEGGGVDHRRRHSYRR